MPNANTLCKKNTKPIKPYNLLSSQVELNPLFHYSFAIPKGESSLSSFDKNAPELKSRRNSRASQFRISLYTLPEKEMKSPFKLETHPKKKNKLYTFSHSSDYIIQWNLKPYTHSKRSL